MKSANKQCRSAIQPVQAARLSEVLFVAVLVITNTIAVASAEEGSRYHDSYPRAVSKKGLQVEMVEDALALGVKHAALNVNLSQIVDPDADGGDKAQPKWTFQDRDFFFNTMYVTRLDQTIKSLSDRGVIVNLIILVYQSGK